MFIKIALFILSLFLLSCNTKNDVSTDSDLQLSVKASDISLQDLKEKSHTFHNSSKQIAILFGYNFNAPEIYTPLVAHLEQKFGAASDNALIVPILYPEDLKRGGHVRVSALTEILQQYSLSGIILLGAPEFTHNSIALLKQSYSGKMPYPVFSFFPQDDLLGTEFISDFVLEDAKAIFQKESDLEQNDTHLAINSEALLDATINYIRLTKESASSSKDLLLQVQSIIGDQGKISFYTDPETGLQSINHFLLY